MTAEAVEMQTATTAEAIEMQIATMAEAAGMRNVGSTRLSASRFRIEGSPQSPRVAHPLRVEARLRDALPWGRESLMREEVMIGRVMREA